jgi:hypothetical protein
MIPQIPDSTIVPTGPESVAFTVHETPAPTRDLASSQTPRGRRTMLLILLACALPVIASYVTYFFIRPGGRTNYATLIEPQRPLPGLELLPAQDLDGHSVPLTILKGQWLLVVVGPGNCDRIKACEERLFMQRQLREMAGAERDRIVKVWLVDSPEPIAPALLAAVQARPEVKVLRVDRTALSQWLQPAFGRALEDHIYIVDPLGNWMMRAPANPDPMKLKKDIERLLRGSAWWNRPQAARSHDERCSRVRLAGADGPRADRAGDRLGRAHDCVVARRAPPQEPRAAGRGARGADAVPVLRSRRLRRLHAAVRLGPGLPRLARLLRTSSPVAAAHAIAARRPPRRAARSPSARHGSRWSTATSRWRSAC